MTAPEFVKGFKAWHDTEPDLIGDARLNEHPLLGTADVIQQTTNGDLFFSPLYAGLLTFHPEDGSPPRMFHWSWKASRQIYEGTE
jgi:hypothetical protein